MKSFLITIFFVSVSFIFTESHWYNVYNNQKQKIGYAVSETSSTPKGFTCSEKVFILNGNDFILADSSEAKLDKKYRLLSMTKKSPRKNYTYTVDVRKRVMYVKLDTGKISIPFKGVIYSNLNGKEAKALKLLKKGRKATIQVAENGKLVKYTARTVARGSLVHGNGKVTVYVIQVSSSGQTGRMFVSKDGVMYKMKVAGVELKKVTKEQAQSVGDIHSSSDKPSNSSNLGSNSNNIPKVASISRVDGSGVNWSRVTKHPELDQIGQRVEDECSLGQGQYLNSIVDINALANTVTTNIGVTGAEKAQYAMQLRSSFNFGTTIAGVVTQGGSYKFLRSSSNPQGLLFRLIDPRGALNYHYYKMTKASGQWKYTDIYVYATGEDVTTSMSTAISLVTQKLGFFDRVMGGESDAQKFVQMTQASRQGQYYKVEQIYNTLSAKAQKAKICLVVRAKAASQLGTEVYQKALQVYLKHFPNETDSNLMALDFYFLRKEFSKVLVSVNKVDQVIDDPYLNIFRGNVYIEMGDNNKGKAAFNKILDAEPDNRMAYFSLIGVALEEKDYPSITRYLIAAEQKAGIQWSLDNVPEYAGYVASPEYQKFLNRGK
ncbi:tetratricopeptide repeat protein [Candidatus Uabimicrobium amorphum]|uniref:Uncharacterized protein n=1 Tax=Uabimicrobium amorphum TaxID=2596890 RepID=A0A5S9IMZ4_UABAM|nr:hypothetical protein [Candidatus Uabimicrobium amorphum]BBM84883.1 hypothetical protein UABAM_03244 [Candidatus Uabimicrobium amorphum]